MLTALLSLSRETAGRGNSANTGFDAPRSTRRRVLMGFSGLVLCGLWPRVWPAPARAETPSDAGKFLVSLSHRAIAMLSDPTATVEVREQQFRALFNEGFDVPSVARFVLGRHGRRATADQRAAFSAVFEDVMVQRFLPLFSGPIPNHFAVGRVQAGKSGARVQTVASKITLSSGKVSEVDWRIVRRDEGYKIMDVVIEGVSMAISLRSEYGTVIQQAGGNLDSLIKVLREKLKTPG